MGELDNAYRAHRARIRATVVATANGIWARDFQNRDSMVARVVPVVEGGQRATATLVDAYMTAKTRMATGAHASVKGIDPGDYTIEKLRGEPADEVYGRPFGLFIHELRQGAPFAAAVVSGQGYMTKLVATDLQMAQVSSARDAMSGSEQIVAYQRVVEGEGCAFCEDAAEALYHTDDLMPIHEHCACDIEPVFFTEDRSFHGDVPDDSEIGARLDTGG